MSEDHFIVMDKQACMPSSMKYGCGSYRRIAVVELDGTVDEPRMISERARGVKRIVKVWERVHKGMSKGIYFDTIREAENLARRLNEEHNALVKDLLVELGRR